MKSKNDFLPVRNLTHDIKDGLYLAATNLTRVLINELSKTCNTKCIEICASKNKRPFNQRHMLKWSLIATSNFM